MFGQLQNELRDWTAKNFPDSDATQQLLGVQEEVGELSHAHLKGIQGIRHDDEEIKAMERDAIGDIVIYLANFCNHRGYDLGKIVALTWEQVKQRQWDKDSKSGGVSKAQDAEISAAARRWYEREKRFFEEYKRSSDREWDDIEQTTADQVVAEAEDMATNACIELFDLFGADEDFKEFARGMI